MAALLLRSAMALTAANQPVNLACFQSDCCDCDPHPWWALRHRAHSGPRVVSI